VCTRTGPKNGHVIYGQFLNTRGKAIELEVLFVEEDATGDFWPRLRAKYFPEKWEGWPETDQDRALSFICCNTLTFHNPNH